MIPKNGWLVRHAQSVANIGIPVDKHQETPLSKLGHKQAEWVGKRMHSSFPPSAVKRIKLVIHSDYHRTKQTLAKFTELQSDLPVEIWPVHEFINIPEKAMNGTSLDERIPYIQEYWDRLEPEYSNEGSESFLEFVARIDHFIEMLQKHPTEKSLICSHNLFLSGVRWRLLHWPKTESVNSKEAMQSYHNILQSKPWKNAEIVPFNVTDKGMIRLRKGARPPTLRFAND